MRYSEGHKADTRERIVVAAAREFRRKGSEAVSVGDIMRAEGLTHGGFYRHFRDKESLLVEAVEKALAQVAGDLQRLTYGSPRSEALARVIEFYLSEEHLQRPEKGCAFAALGSELARYPRRARAPIACALERYRLALQWLLPGQTDDERKAAFEVLFPAMAGCLTAARAHVDGKRRAEILGTARRFFLQAFCPEEFGCKGEKV